MTSHTLAIIPQPLEMKFLGGELRLSNPIRVRIEQDTEKIREIAEYFRLELHRRNGLDLQLATTDDASESSSTLTLTLLDDRSLASDGAYRLSGRESGVTVRAGSASGLFYGLQTLLQLIPPDIAGTDHISLPGVEIEDRPRFGWRGMHLDVSRHFSPVDFIKKYIDLLALHKMNLFHWHLTDDQGWRIEIKKYPRLTEIGAWRKEQDGKSYGGFYTHREIGEIVEYARRRFVTVVPEIEMPGHAVAALAAYPEYSCTGGPFEVETRWGVFDDVYCAGKDATFEFLRDILAEVADLFPGTYVHIGGDECPKARWQAHHLCQTRMFDALLKNEDELQAYFVARMARTLTALGKRLVGWDEILDGGAPEGAIIMAWRNAEKGVEAALSGHDVVMTPGTHCYFDHYQGKENEPKAIGGFTPLEKVYSFEPIPENLPAALTHHVLGAQGNVWTEYMPNTNHIEYMVFPRLCALSEVLWSPREPRVYPEFLRRLGVHAKRLDRLGVNYRPITAR
jgi:hexosaminidase